MMNGVSGAKSRAQKRTCFLLLEPKNLCNSGDVARKLARCRGVREVHLTSGRYGFVVCAKAGSEKDFSLMSSSVRKLARARSVKMAVSQMVYR
jgi:hypothetical protein